MSHPLIVEAAETLFVPVCIYNNSSGDADAELREAFGEPAWNNPVVRILDAEREDLVPRITGDWSLGRLATAMVRTLEDRDPQQVPVWLRLLAESSHAEQAGLDVAIFGMG